MKSFKPTTLALAAVTMCVASVTCQNAQANTISFASVPGGADIQFNGGGTGVLGGGTFGFLNATSGTDTGYSFVVNNSDMLGDSIGDLGTVSGTYTIGPIAVSGTTQSAAVTGSGTLTIADGHGFDLTGTVSWDDISTTGTGSTLNLNGLFNVTGVTYNGTQVDLNTLAASGILSDTVDFTFNPAQTLEALDSTGGTTTYSGTITAPVPDGAATVGLLGGALLAITVIRRKIGR